MIHRDLLPILLLIWVVLFTFGCSQASDPVVPDNPNDLTASRCVEFNGNRMLWGWWDISIDSATGQVEIVPVRGPAFNANVMQFLHPPFSPTNMMEISILGSSNLPEGYVDVDVTFHHPFPGMNQFSGFDVKGIFMADGSQNGDHDPDITYGDVDHNEAHMLNADGCTRWWNASEFVDPVPMFSFKPGKMGNDSHPTATLNPYKYYADDMPYDGDVAEMDTGNRGVFTPDGPTHRRNYKIQFPVIGDVPIFMFSYAVDASWEPPDPMGAPDYDIDYFGPGAQCQEAYHLSANTNESDLWYEDGDFGGMIHLEVEVFDWQGASSISGVPGEVSAIWIESPIITSPVDILPQATAYPGSQVTSSVFEVDLDTGLLMPPSDGDFPMMITVESADPKNYMPQLDGGEGFIFPDGPLAAYKMGLIHVLSEMPYQPAPDVTGDVTLAVERSGQTMTGVTLDWTDNGSPFYAIYADDNPYNGLNPTIFVVEVSTNTATITESVWDDFSTNGAYVFGVKGRTVSGMVGSESPNMSQLAFVEMEDFDGGSNPEPWIEGYRDVNYKWEEETPGLIDGSTSIRSNPVCPIGQWAVIASEPVPVIPDSEYSIMEFAHIASNFSWLAYYKELSAGFTHSVPPTGTSQYLDYDSTTNVNAIIDGTWDWVHISGGWIGLVERFGWNSNYTFFGWRFADCPHGTAQLTRMDFPYFIQDAGSIRPAMAWVTNTWTNNDDWMEVDEIAVVIY